MRIISGTHRGKHIIPDKSFSARPTTDFAKENLFNVLTNYIDIEGLRVLDLFSGTGSISYEFASRGAAEIYSIEMNFKHYAFIKNTARELGFQNMKIYKADVFTACKKLEGHKFDVIFADPPYKLERIPELPDCIFHHGLLAEGGIVIIEHPAGIDFSTHSRFREHREYGSVNFTLFQ